MNKWINTFSTEEEYYAYINGDTDHYPSISFIESTNSVYILDEEPTPEPPAVEYSLVLSKCSDPSEGDWCITQGFCDDSDYYVILMDGDSIATYDGQTVEYESFGETYHPQLIDPSAGTCVWFCSAIDPSITEVVCYDSDMHPIATLETSCL